jgi:hypothetical protein
MLNSVPAIFLPLRRRVLCAALWAGLAMPAVAMAAPPQLVSEEDTLIRGARECTRHMPVQEGKYAIPQHLLMAIGSNESGRYHNGLKAVVPWPWTVNAAGKGYYFASKQEAISAVRRFQSDGIQSIDVGCMQVNLKHHPSAFTSLQNAFDPEANVAYAARFLRTNYESTKSWIKAVAYYHSQTPKYGTPYAQRIYERWKFVLERGGKTPEVAMAAVGAAPTSQELASLQAAMNKRASEKASSTAKKAAPAANAALARADAIRNEKPKMKVIRVYQAQPEMQVVNQVADNGGVRMEQGVKIASAAPISSVGARIGADERAKVSAVSNMIIQDIADAQNAYGPSVAMERGVSVSRGQFAPKREAKTAANVSSGSDGDFVLSR